jgi:ketosteroid isomerase-like protein
MKNFFVGLAVFFAFSPGVLAVPDTGPAGQSGTEEAKIIELDKQWYELRIKQDFAALEQLLAADFVMTTSYGRVVTRDELLGRARSGEHFFKLKSFKTDDVKVRIYGNVAVVTGRAAVDAEASDLRVGSAVRFTRAYVRADGRWRLAVHQATRIIR